MEKKEQYNSTISVMRALAALFVISQHVPYEGSLQFVYYFMCTAVPFFFLVAGYFSWNMDEKVRGKKIVKHLKKMVLVYVSAYLFYYMISVGLKYAVNAIFHTNIAVSFENWNLLELIKGILLDIDPFASHLWFLYAMIIIYVFLYLIHWDKMIYVGLIVSIIVYLISKTNFTVGTVLEQAHFGMFMNVPLVYAGYFLHYMEDRGFTQRYKLFTNNWMFISSILLIALYLLEEKVFCTIFPRNMQVNYIAMFFFLLSLKYKNIGRNTVIEKIGAKYTLGIYIFHIFVMHMWERVKVKLTFNPNSSFWNEMDIFIVYGLTLLLYMFLIFAANETIRSVKKVRRGEKNEAEII